MLRIWWPGIVILLWAPALAGAQERCPGGLSSEPLEALIPESISGFVDKSGYASRDWELPPGATRGLEYEWTGADQGPRDMFYNLYISLWRFPSAASAAEFVDDDIRKHLGRVTDETVGGCPVKLVVHEYGGPRAPSVRTEFVYTEATLVVEIWLDRSRVGVPVNANALVSQGKRILQEMLDADHRGFR